MSTNPRFTQAIAGDKTHCIAFGDFLHFWEAFEIQMALVSPLAFFSQIFPNNLFPPGFLPPRCRVGGNNCSLSGCARCSCKSHIDEPHHDQVEKVKVTLCHSATKIYSVTFRNVEYGPSNFFTLECWLGQYVHSITEKIFNFLILTR